SRLPPGSDADPDARRLGRAPAAQGLPARWHPGAVQGRHDSTAGRAEGLQVSDMYAPTRETTEGRVYNLAGGDWDQVLGGDPLTEERLVLNMGPQHPSTHGVLRLVVE